MPTPIVFANKIIKYPTTYKIWLDCPYCGKVHGHGEPYLRYLGTANAQRSADCGGGEYIIDTDRYTSFK